MLIWGEMSWLESTGVFSWLLKSSEMEEARPSCDGEVGRRGGDLRRSSSRREGESRDHRV